MITFDCIVETAIKLVLSAGVFALFSTMICILVAWVYDSIHDTCQDGGFILDWIFMVVKVLIGVAGVLLLGAVLVYLLIAMWSTTLFPEGV